MNWKFDEYDESFASLVSLNGNVAFVVRRSDKVLEMYEVVLYYTLHQYREIKLCYSKEEAMSFVEELIRSIRTIE